MLLHPYYDLTCDVLRIGISTTKVFGCHGYNNKHAHEKDGNYKENILFIVRLCKSFFSVTNDSHI